MMIFFILLFFFSGIGSPNSFSLQADPGPEHVEKTIIQLFDAMRESDRDLAEAVFHPSATLATVREQHGETVLVTSDISAFLDAIARPKDDLWDEQYSHLEIHVDGHLASAWMNYTFYRGGEFSHCGVNAMKLIYTENSWKIFSVTDTRRTENCHP